MAVVLKLKFNSDTYRVLLSDSISNLSFNAIQEEIRGVSLGRSVSAKYLDEEGDLATLCESSFPDFLTQVTERNGKTILALELFDTDRVSPTAAPEASQESPEVSQESTKTHCEEAKSIREAKSQRREAKSHKRSTSEEAKSHKGHVKKSKEPHGPKEEQRATKEQQGEAKSNEREQRASEASVSEKAMEASVSEKAREASVSEKAPALSKATRKCARIGCELAVTWHPTHCCGKCAAQGGHDRCDGLCLDKDTLKDILLKKAKQLEDMGLGSNDEILEVLKSNGGSTNKTIETLLGEPEKAKTNSNAQPAKQTSKPCQPRKAKNYSSVQLLTDFAKLIPTPQQLEKATKQCARIGCQLAVTWHPTHCCGKCRAQGGHDRCDGLHFDKERGQAEQRRREREERRRAEEQRRQAAENCRRAEEQRRREEEVQRCKDTCCEVVQKMQVAGREVKLISREVNLSCVAKSAETTEMPDKLAETKPAEASVQTFNIADEEDELMESAKKLQEMGLGSFDVLFELLRRHDGSEQRVIDALFG